MQLTPLRGTLGLRIHEHLQYLIIRRGSTTSMVDYKFTDESVTLLIYQIYIWLDENPISMTGTVYKKKLNEKNTR